MAPYYLERTVYFSIMNVNFQKQTVYFQIFRIVYFAQKDRIFWVLRTGRLRLCWNYNLNETKVLKNGLFEIHPLVWTDHIIWSVWDEQYHIVNMVWSGPRYKMYEVVHGMKWFMVWGGQWYEVTSGIKWPRVWSDFGYEVTPVWSDPRYEVTRYMKWLKIWSDSRYEVNMGCSEHIFSLWYEVTPKIKWTWYGVTGYQYFVLYPWNSM